MRVQIFNNFPLLEKYHQLNEHKSAGENMVHIMHTKTNFVELPMHSYYTYSWLQMTGNIEFKKHSILVTLNMTCNVI